MRKRTRSESRSIRPRRKGRLPRVAGILFLVSGMALAAGCATERAPDALAERCVYVLEYRQPTLGGVEVIEARRNTAGTALTVHYEATLEPAPEPIDDLIFCAFEPLERWTLQRVVIGNRELSEAELALVNAELLLMDLSRNPQRLSRGASRHALPSAAPTLVANAS